MKHTAAHKLMIKDGAPAALFISPERRAKHWAGRSLTVVPFAQVKATRNEDEATAAFRAAEDERRRAKSLAGIARMKMKFASKAIDHSKMRWDARHCKFVPLTGDRPNVPASDQGLARLPDRPAKTKPATTPDQRAVSQAVDVTRQDWSRVTKTTAKSLAALNGVWDDKYAKLNGGLLVMTVTNRLKGLVKKGGEVRWQ